jgi:protein O-mannosyl-transferase
MLCIALSVLVLAVFGGTLRNGFVNLDDRLYVTHNAHVLKGFSAENLRWALGAGLGQASEGTDYWMPLSLVSHMAVVQMFGLEPAAHHAVNVLLHAVTVLLLFLVLRSMTGSPRRSALVTALWAVHPLRVESVAWLAERKDLLGGLFFVLSLACYLRTVRSPSPTAHVCLLLSFALGLMSKPILVPLPFLLLLLDWWPLRRCSGLRDLPSLILQKLPLLTLSLLSCLLTLHSQKQALDPLGQGSLSLRIGKALVALCVYPVKTILPVGLAVYYPFPLHGWGLLRVIPCLILILAVTVLVLRFHRRHPYLALGWFWYLLMIIPASGIVLAGDQAYADRFTYLPQIGLLLAAVWLAADWAKRRACSASLTRILAVTALVLCCAATVRQLSFWRNDLPLWKHAVEVTRENAFARNELGNALIQEGRAGDAVTEYREALRINPRQADALGNLGEALRREGHREEALACLNKALALDPRNAEAENNLGSLLFQNGSQEEALLHYRRSVQLDPLIPGAHNMIGTIELMRGREEAALPEFQKALALNPRDPSYANNVAWILATSKSPTLRDPRKALALARGIVAGDPNHPALLRTLAAAEAATGDRAAALQTARKAMEQAKTRGDTQLCLFLREEIARYERD